MTLSILTLAKRIHKQYEIKVQCQTAFYSRCRWEDIGDVCQQEFLDVAAAILDGKTELGGHPIPAWAIALNFPLEN